eukprot:2702378-Pyramimonas_sp.AAC.1
MRCGTCVVYATGGGGRDPAGAHQRAAGASDGRGDGAIRGAQQPLRSILPPPRRRQAGLHRRHQSGAARRHDLPVCGQARISVSMVTGDHSTTPVYPPSRTAQPHSQSTVGAEALFGILT